MTSYELFSPPHIETALESKRVPGFREEVDSLKSLMTPDLEENLL